MAARGSVLTIDEESAVNTCRTDPVAWRFMRRNGAADRTASALRVDWFANQTPAGLSGINTSCSSCRMNPGSDCS
jgi:hypothetical protein